MIHADSTPHSPRPMRRPSAVVRIATSIGFALALGLASGVVAQSSLRVGVVQYKTADIVEATYRPLCEHLASTLGRRCELQQLTGQELRFRLKNDQLDLGIFKPFTYIEAHDAYPELEVFATHLVRGAASYKGVVLTLDDGLRQSLAEVRASDLLFVKRTSTSGFRLPRGILREYGLELREEDMRFSQSHAVSFDELQAGRARVIAIDASALEELDADVSSTPARELHRYDVPYQAYVLSPEMDSAVGESLSDTLLDLHNDPDARHILDNPLGIDQWVAVTDEHYNPLRRFVVGARTKPGVQVAVSATARTQAQLEERGDMLEATERAARRSLIESGRFGESDNNLRRVELELLAVEDAISIEMQLDGTRLTPATVEASGSDLPERIAFEVRSAVLGSSALALVAPLHRDAEGWFTTYGLTDGIGEDYRFAIVDDGREIAVLGRAEAGGDFAGAAIDELTTRFDDHPGFVEGADVRISYLAPASYVAAPTRIRSGQEGFWDNLDNRWGVVGVVLALLTVFATWYVTRRTRHRFRNLLEQTNDLLREMVSDRLGYEERIVSLKQHITNCVVNGEITEAQSAELHRRLEDMRQYLIRFFDAAERSPEILQGGGPADPPPASVEELAKMVTALEQSTRDFGAPPEDTSEN